MEGWMDLEGRRKRRKDGGINGEKEDWQDGH